MDLSSLLFLFLFLPVFLVIYLVAARQLKLPIILAASAIFLAWADKTALVWLSGIIIFGYVMGLVIDSSRHEGRRFSIWLWFATAIIFLILLFFKFKTAQGEVGLTWLHFPQSWITSTAGLAVPIGLSYVTFQVFSYLVDVWRGNSLVEKNFIPLAAWLLFFPKLTSGPITRYKSFAPQLDGLNPSFEDIAGGFRRLLGGFVKRTVIANQLALMTNAVFGLPSANITPLFAWLAL